MLWAEQAQLPEERGPVGRTGSPPLDCNSSPATPLRKVAKAVNKQPGLQPKLAALMAIRMKVPVGNHWSFYLSADARHQQEELQILEDWGAQLATSTTT